MGLNTTVVVRNDCLGDIESDPEFGRTLANGVQSIRCGHKVDIPSLRSSNAATVIETHHVDNFHLILVGGGTGYDLGHAGDSKLLDPNNVGHLQIILNIALNGRGLKVIKDTKLKRG